MSVLVTGGAGYVGSHAVLQLQQKGYHVIIVDNLSKGHADACSGAKLYDCDLKDKAAVDAVFAENKIEGVFHFGASTLVAESVANPLLYYSNNITSAINLIEAMVNHGVKNIVFSSTAAVYGEPKRIPICEDDEKQPRNPYGETKLAIEKMLYWCHGAYGINSVSLRYFNVAGADASGTIRERHDPETHIIPIILNLADKDNPEFTLFGNDYDTPDGTCIRDYIHITDLIDAHILAYNFLQNNAVCEYFNLGSGTGFSNLEIYNISREITSKDIALKYMSRRAGDPATLIASSEKAQSILGWKPRFTDLRDIIGSAYNALTNN